MTDKTEIKKGDKVQWVTKYGDLATGIYTGISDVPGLGPCGGLVYKPYALIESLDCWGHPAPTATQCIVPMESLHKVEESTLLSCDKIAAFRLATATNNNGGYSEAATFDDAYCSENEVTQTRDTVASFIEKWGAPHETEVSRFGKLLIWNDLQTRKGARRGNLYVMDFGNARAAYFGGES